MTSVGGHRNRPHMPEAASVAAAVAAAVKSGSLSGTFGLLPGSDALDRLSFSSSVGGTVQAVIESRKFHMGLEPVGIIFDQFLQFLGCGLVLSDCALQHR